MTEDAQPNERRSHPRVPVDIWVEEATDRELYLQRGANLSQGGIFLQRTIPHPPGTHVRLQFTLPGSDEPISVEGEIVNVESAASKLGMGIRFVDPNDELLEKIGAFIDKVGSAS